MRFANLMFATLLLSAVAGAALASTEERVSPAAAGAESLKTSVMWLWQPQMRRIATR